MSELKDVLADAVIKPFQDAAHCAADADKHGWQAPLWAQIYELGLPKLLVAESQGGIGGDWEDAGAILHAAGLYAIPLPIAESMLAEKLAAEAGLNLPEGASSIAVDVDGKIENGCFSGTLKSVPWGGDVDHIVLQLQNNSRRTVILSRHDASEIVRVSNIASEPRDTLVFNLAHASIAQVAASALSLADYATLLRSAQISGAIESALRMTIDYAKEREQFGRSISKFQAVQQALALFGADSAAASCAARAACRSLSRPALDDSNPAFVIGAAKLRANMAIDIATSTAHQIHAAIGFTEEYTLRHFTQRLWAWRSELGNDHYWSARLAEAVLTRGASHFWADLTNRDDQSALGEQQ
jgi:acyl-CoA dehydrogenase